MRENVDEDEQLRRKYRNYHLRTDLNNEIRLRIINSDENVTDDQFLRMTRERNVNTLQQIITISMTLLLTNVLQKVTQFGTRTIVPYKVRSFTITSQ